MPLPKPEKGEAKEAFIARCIETLAKYDQDKFPSRAQRAAVCYSQWGETLAEKQAYEEKNKAGDTQNSNAKTKLQK